MELAKNKASGQIFVVLDDSGGRYFLGVTPDGRVKQLERKLFLLGSEVANTEIEPERLVNDKQISTYETYCSDY